MIANEPAEPTKSWYQWVWVNRYLLFIRYNYFLVIAKNGDFHKIMG